MAVHTTTAIGSPRRLAGLGAVAGLSIPAFTDSEPPLAGKGARRGASRFPSGGQNKPGVSCDVPTAVFPPTGSQGAAASATLATLFDIAIQRGAELGVGRYESVARQLSAARSGRGRWHRWRPQSGQAARRPLMSLHPRDVDGTIGKAAFPQSDDQGFLPAQRSPKTAPGMCFGALPKARNADRPIGKAGLPAMRQSPRIWPASANLPGACNRGRSTPLQRHTAERGGLGDDLGKAGGGIKRPQA